MRALVTIAATGILVAALAGSAPSGTTKTPKLTAAEKKALDIVSVEAVGVRPIGLVVTVTFKGNIERAIGRGNLRDALVALLLTAKGSSRATEGLVAQGPGAVGTTLQRTKAKSVGVLRGGRKLTFLIGGRVSPLDRIVVKTFATSPPVKASARANAGRNDRPAPIPRKDWELLEDAIANDESFLASENVRRAIVEADCLSRAAILDIVKRDTASAEERRQRLLRLDSAIADAIGQLEKGGGKSSPSELKTISGVFLELVGESTDVQKFNEKGALLAELRQAARIVKRLIARNDALLLALENFAVAAKLEADAPCAIRAVFSQEERTTTYSWVNSSDFYFRWTLLPPANDPKCNNGGRLSGSEKEFDWYHADAVCDHSKEDPGKGHLGSIALTVSFADTKCKAVYLGTFTGTGPQGTCEKR